jgi:hypothetical protein
MKDIEVFRVQQRLDNLFKQVDQIQDPELRSHFARYLCVLVAGFLETSVRRFYSQYARNGASPAVANYVELQLKWFQNPTIGKICELARAFDPAWEADLRAHTEGDLKDAIESIMANRHNIAHGGASGISYVTIKNYYERSIKVLDLIEEQCGL